MRYERALRYLIDVVFWVSVGSKIWLSEWRAGGL